MLDFVQLFQSQAKSAEMLDRQLFEPILAQTVYT
jgi:hypothetical protein